MRQMSQALADLNVRRGGDQGPRHGVAVVAGMTTDICLGDICHVTGCG